MRRGSRFDTGHLAISWVNNEAGGPRLAFVVALHGGTAVARNRLRRRLREILRTQAMDVIGNRDVVIRTRPNAYSADFDTLTAELVKWLRSLQG